MFRVSVLLVGSIAVIGFAGAGVPDARVAAPRPRICFFVDSPHFRVGQHAAYGTGHAFVQLIPDAGDKTSPRSQVYGHGAGTGWPLLSNGETQDNSDHPWDWKICYDVSQEQYDKAAVFIRGEQANPSEYHLFGENCTDWVGKIADLVGVTLPSSTTPESPKLHDPAVLEDNLQKIGDGHTFHDGTVHMNSKTHPVSPKDTRDPQPASLDACSITGLVQFAERDPGLLAKGLGKRPVSERLPNKHVAERTPLITRILARLVHIRLGPSPWLQSNALVAIDWGDGKRSFETLSARHVYSEPGTYDVSYVIIDSGDVVRAQYDAIVTLGGGSATQTFELPKPPPLKPLEPPGVGPRPCVFGSPPPVCEPTAMGSLSNGTGGALAYSVETNTAANAFELTIPGGTSITSVSTPSGFTCTDTGNVEECKNGTVGANTPETGSFVHSGTIAADCGCVQVAFSADNGVTWFAKATLTGPQADSPATVTISEDDTWTWNTILLKAYVCVNVRTTPPQSFVSADITGPNGYHASTNGKWALGSDGSRQLSAPATQWGDYTKTLVVYDANGNQTATVTKTFTVAPPGTDGPTTNPACPKPTE